MDVIITMTTDTGSDVLVLIGSESAGTGNMWIVAIGALDLARAGATEKVECFA